MSNTKKSNSRAIHCRNEGNDLYKQGKFFDALIKYNESLASSEDDENLALAFNNRSSVFFELHLYRQCLNNIKLARVHNYPNEKMSKLNERESKCRSSVNTPKVTNPFDFFKLSYKQNEKIPFIIDGLELKTSEKYGRQIVTTRPLKVGDVISVESPFLKVLNSNCTFNYCNFCLNDNLLDLIPCENCSSAMFCNETCKTAANAYHQYECSYHGALQKLGHHYLTLRSFFKALTIVDGSIEELEKIFNECQESPKTYFDFDFSDADDAEFSRNQLRASLGLAKDDTIAESAQKTTGNRFPDLVFEASPKLNELWTAHKTFITKFFLHLYQVGRKTTSDIIRWPLNYHKFESVGRGNYLVGAFINHSCCPNVFQFAVEDKTVTIVSRPIEKGEQIFDCYTGVFYDMPKAERQALIKRNFSIMCDCEACKDPQRYQLCDALKVNDLKKLIAAENAYSTSVSKDFAKKKRNQQIKTVEELKVELQLNYKPKLFPNKEYVVYLYAFVASLKSLSRRDNLFFKS